MQDKLSKKNIFKATASANSALNLLGGMPPEQFLAQYWQKKPLLIRQAFTQFNGLLEPNDLAGLACDEDVQSRIVEYKAKQWHLQQGPFDEDTFANLPEKDWTLLVQSVNHHLEEAEALLKHFHFIPHARLDDLMVSYAPDGGGVGPHFDSYDVFLLQGMGQRLWRISEQTDLTLIEDAPLKILKHFKTEQEFLLNPGDMLYLPPQVAHWGIAVGECMTYSIGFRAPSMRELAAQFLLYMHERVALAGMVNDPQLVLQKHPAELPKAMLQQVAEAFKQISWQEDDVAQFLGCYLSEPKSHIVFEPPMPCSLNTFSKRMQTQGLKLALKSQALFYKDTFFMNGEPCAITKTTEECLKILADTRALNAMQCSAYVQQCPNLLTNLHAWYLAGYITY